MSALTAVRTLAQAARQTPIPRDLATKNVSAPNTASPDRTCPLSAPRGRDTDVSVPLQAFPRLTDEGLRHFRPV
jgi:hypothetical protein